MPHEQVINKFVSNDIDGYALLMLDKNDLVEMIIPASQPNSSTADEHGSMQGPVQSDFASSSYMQEQRYQTASQAWNGQSSI